MGANRAFMERGGHVAFMHGGTPWSASPWAEEEAARFLAEWLVPDSTA
jgi:predicted alpha/beta-fold hydrolase